MITILVPTDFSENAGQALDNAIGLARDTDAKIILVHGYFKVFLSPDPAEYILEQMTVNRKEAEARLSMLSEKVTRENIICEVVNEEELAVDIILKVAEINHPDMIVMGTKGAGGISAELFGTNTSKVLKQATCPVITIPPDTVFTPLRKIVYATDYHTGDIEAIAKLAELGNRYNAKITVVHVADLDYLDEETEYNCIEKFGERVRHQVNYENLDFKLYDGPLEFDTFEDILDEEKPCLFAMSTYHRNLWDRLFGSSSSRAMAFHSRYPLITFRSEERAKVIELNA